MLRSALILIPAAAWCAQLEVLTLPNWQRVPVGEDGLVEGGAVVARTAGPSATFANPAGLAGLEKPTISGSLTMLEYTRTASRGSGGGAQADQTSVRPNLVGFAEAWEADNPDGTGWGFSLSSPIDWNSSMQVQSRSSTGSRRDYGTSSLNTLVPSFGLGWRLGREVKMGAALDAWLCSYSFSNGTSANDGTTLLTSAYSESGRLIALRVCLGAQWESRWLNAGIAIRSPGLRLSDKGEIDSSTTSGDGTSTAITDISDTAVGFAMPLPLAITAGVAWRPTRIPDLVIEADLAFVAGGASTTVLGSATGSTSTTDSGGTTVVPYITPDRRYDPRWVLDPRLGVAWRTPWHLLDRDLTLHAGGYVERSPVSNSDVFARLDLIGATGGATLEHGPLRTTIGALYVTNATLRQALGSVTSPQTGLQADLANTDAEFAVRSFILVLGTTYRFGL